jgi:excisionase family DNA binding protein
LQNIDNYQPVSYSIGSEDSFPLARGGMKGDKTLNTTEEKVDMYIPVRQVAKEWNVNKAFVLQEIKEGKLEAFDIGGYKIKRSTLDAYIQAKKVQPVNK